MSYVDSCNDLGGYVNLGISGLHPGTGLLCARLGGPSGPILRLYETHNFTAKLVMPDYFPVFKTYTNGDLLIGNTFEITPRFDGHKVEIRIITGTPEFETGGKTKWLPTADFDQKDQHPFYIISGESWNACHVTGNVKEVE